MNRTEFLSELKKQLQQLPEAEQDTALADYKEHFDHGMFEGRSEEEIAAKLGSPKKIARELLTEYHLTRAEQSHSYMSIIRAVFTSLGLGLLNLIFVLAPFLVVSSLLIAGYVVSIGLALSPITILLAIISQPSWQSLLLLGFITLGLFGAGLLLGTGTIIATKKFFNGFTHYLKSSLTNIRGVK